MSEWMDSLGYEAQAHLHDWLTTSLLQVEIKDLDNVLSPFLTS